MGFFQFEPACALRVDDYHIGVFGAYAGGIVKDTGRDGDNIPRRHRNRLFAQSMIETTL